MQDRYAGNVGDFMKLGCCVIWLPTRGHADRFAKARVQAARRLEGLAIGVRQEPVAAVVARRGSCRFFLVTAADEHRDRLDAALRWFVALRTSSRLAAAVQSFSGRVH